MTDLEKQLQASLPGRPTEVQDYAGLWVARAQIELAMKLLTDARASISIILGAERAACEQCTQAALLAAKSKLDIERAIKAHPAGRPRP
jgi:hypothetical protein